MYSLARRQPKLGKYSGSNDGAPKPDDNVEGQFVSRIGKSQNGMVLWVRQKPMSVASS